jgi:hypothetical protein
MFQYYWIKFRGRNILSDLKKFKKSILFTQSISHYSNLISEGFFIKKLPTIHPNLPNNHKNRPLKNFLPVLSYHDLSLQYRLKITQQTMAISMK